MTGSVVFFDLWGTLLRRGPRGLELMPDAEKMLRRPQDQRLGVLCNAGAGQTRRDVIRALEETQVDLRFRRELIISTSELPVPLTDRRAFAVAAALAETPVDQCVFVSASARMRICAAAAGMQTSAPDALTESAGSTHDASTAADSGMGLLADGDGGASFGASLLAGEVDEDTGPTFALRGRVVTMDASSRIIEDGRVIIRRGKIVDIAEASKPMPQDLKDLTVRETGGTIYPGLIDLHNHFAYNVLPLWVVPRRADGKPFQDRSQWPKHKEYKPFVTAPLSLMAAHSPTAEAIVRYVEAKALMGGTTTGQGIRGKSGTKTTPTMYHGAMRNVEETNDPRLPEARTMVPDLQTSPDKIDDFLRALKDQEEIGAAYFYHLAEGGVETARKHYLLLQQSDLLRPALVGIHALGLAPADLGTLAQHGAKVVWSPYSNMLLYGKEMDLVALKESGVLFSIGCDWTPTGSKNLLFELKVARFMAQARPQAGMSSEDLVRAVTANAAHVAGWNQHLGVIREGALADLVVIAGDRGNAYDHLIDAVERDVRLVVIHGVPRYGDKELMEALPADAAHPAETLVLGASAKLLNTFTPGSQINHLNLQQARERLEDAMSDLPAFREKVESARGPDLLGDESDTQGFTLMLDNEFIDADVAIDAASLLADAKPVVLPKRIELDDLVPGNSEDYWKRVRLQPDLSPGLKEELEHAYSK